MATTIERPPAAAPDESTLTAEDVGFGKAILFGSLVGIVVFGVLCFVTIRIVGSSISMVADLGISVWVGIWAGLFLGGTIAVGRWSMRQAGH